MKLTLGMYVAGLALIVAGLVGAAVVWALRAANARLNAVIAEFVSLRVVGARVDEALLPQPAQIFWCCCGCGKDTGALALLYVDETCANRHRVVMTEAARATYPVPMPRTTAEFKPDPGLARRFT